MVEKAALKDEYWHSLETEEVLSALKTSKKGLSLAEVSERSITFGLNKLPEKHRINIWKIIISQLVNPLIFILIAAGIASVLIGEPKDAIFILVVILINTLIGAFQEYNAEKSAANLQKLLRINSRIIREGSEQNVDSEELVPGDLVLLESGSKVPADIRLIEAHGLEIDESFLTGESQSVIKRTAALYKETVLAEKVNMAFAGATVMSGRGMGIVIGTGLDTEVGKIAQNVSHGVSAKPPLILRMERFTKNIAYFIVGLCVVLAVLLRIQGMEMSAIFFFVVALSVSAIPEGLPVSLTVALAVATKRMAKRNVIVRKLTSVESLGSCTVIASDKTGTLTVNQQTVKKIFFPDGKSFDVTGEGYNGEGDFYISGSTEKVTDPARFNPLRQIIEISALANEAVLEKRNDIWKYHGDAMDVALLGMAYKAKINPQEIHETYPVIAKIPYESEKKFSAAFYKRGSATYCGIKGAVETVLDFCCIPEEKGFSKEQVSKQADELAANGYRVLAFAENAVEEIDFDTNFQLDILPDLEFVGLICFIDPLRAEAKSAVDKCKSAGVKVIMITGDHPSTAANISRELSIQDYDKPIVTGKMLSSAGPSEFKEMVNSTFVFGRVSPQQKLEIVDVLINSGEFVAVTGDGVNDAPALKRANIGVAMGSGTDVAKDVGAMIVVDDNFSSIVAGVEEGRFAYDNVRKVIYLLVSTGASEVLMVLLAIIFGLPLPLLAVQLLWLNLVTNGIQDKALALEAGEPETMHRKPRKPSEGIFNKIMTMQIVLSGLVIGSIAFGYWYYLINQVQMEEESARNLVLLFMVLVQNVHVFNCRSERKSTFKISIAKNYWLIIFIVAVQALHIGSMYIPSMQDILRISPISLNDWVTVLILAFPIVIVMEIFKLIYNRMASDNNEHFPKR
jgi:magnesium-transporting ATPase (P-type)